MSPSGDVVLVYDPAMVGHDPGAGHPDSPSRLATIVDDLERRPVAGTRWAAPATFDAARWAELLASVHSPAMVERIEALRGRCAGVDPDTWVSPGSIDAAHAAVGSAIAAVDAVVGGHAARAFSLVRPPGHHAERDRALGFCLYNNVAIAAQYARTRLGCERVMIVDWDVHHGNGTQQMFYERRDVLFVSSHQFPFYPGTGAVTESGRGAGEGYTVNLPLTPGLRDDDVLAIYEDLIPAIAEQFDPDLVLVSAGFDAHRDDPLAGLALTEHGFARLCALVRGIADRHANGRLVLALEGGYDLEALRRSARASVQVLCDASPASEARASTTGAGLGALRLARDQHGKYWKI